MDARDTGGLGSYLSKARTKHLEDQAKVVVTDQVDARKVKKEASFNMYAIFVISTVIASVVFFWVKIKRAQSRKSA